MQIENCTASDMDEIFRLYAIAAAYQQAKQTVVVWPAFDKQLIEVEIGENRQWKLLINNTIACIWATTFSDEQIWEHRNTDPAVYIHRIATHPGFRGNKFIVPITAWAKNYAKINSKKFVRLDTLGNNTRLIEHYTSAGFNFLGMFDLKNTQGFPRTTTIHPPAFLK